MDDVTRLAQLVEVAERFANDAHALLARHEGARSRVAVLEATYNQLDRLSLAQDDLLRQALRCAEMGLYRAAIVMGWASLADLVEEKLSSDGLTQLRSLRPKWVGRDMAEISEHVPERQFLDVARELGLLTKNQSAALQSLLNRRNECAHPSTYYPDLNETLGYLAEIIRRAGDLAARSLAP
jgi:hypothetical protein